MLTDKIWADEFQVENAIKGGLYHIIFREEFNKLDSYLESLAMIKQKLTVRPIELMVLSFNSKGFYSEKNPEN